MLVRVWRVSRQFPGHDLPGGGVEPFLPGDEDEAVGDDGLRVRADRGGAPVQSGRPRSPGGIRWSWFLLAVQTWGGDGTAVMMPERAAPAA